MSDWADPNKPEFDVSLHVFQNNSKCIRLVDVTPYRSFYGQTKLIV